MNILSTSFYDYLDVICVIFIEISFLVFVFSGVILSNKRRQIDNLDFSDASKDLGEINYYRGIPCNNDLFKAYWVIYNYKLVSEYVLHQGIIGAFLLKWIKEEKIKIVPTREGIMDLNNNLYAINFNIKSKIIDRDEKKLFMMLKVASDDGILEVNEFSIWCKKNSSMLNSWFFSQVYNTQVRLEKEGLITVSNDKNKKISKIISNDLKEEAKKIEGLKKFMLDFSIIEQRDAIEVHLWDDYLIFAQLLGIADKVDKQFNVMHSDISKLNNIRSDNVEAVSRFVHNGIDESYKEVSDKKK